MFLDKIKKGINDFGVIIYAVYVIKRLLHYISKKISIQFVYFFVIPVEQNRRIKIPSFIRNIYKVDMLNEYSDVLKQFPVTRKTIEYRFKQNAVCLVAMKNKNPIGFFWLVQKKYQEDIMFCDIHMVPEIAWDFDLWILDEFRLTPAFSILWDYAFDYLEKKNVTLIYSRISTINNTSVEVHERLGGHVVGKILFVKYGDREICLEMIQRRLSTHSPLNRKIIKL